MDRMTQREKFVAEIKRMEQAMSQTDSMYLRKDYDRGIKRMKRELAEYDRFHRLEGKETKIDGKQEN